MKRKQTLKISLIVFLLTVFVGNALAQPGAMPTKTITGKVVDKTDEPIPGVSVSVKGTTIATMTDIAGGFNLEVPENATIKITLVGHTAQEISVSGKDEFLIKLLEDDLQLEEVVVIGYGMQKKVNMTGAVSSVDFSKAAESRPITSISAGLAGLSSGVYVNQSGGGRPGYEGATIRIRGQGTLNNYDPLVIIDGTFGNMEDVNPQDVESISVLKDAASSAIYGSRAANGVILITTKRGKSGDARIAYSGQFTAQSVSNKLNIVSDYADYMELVNEGYYNTNPTAVKPFSTAKIEEWRNAGSSDPEKYPNTDWQDEVFKTGWMQNHTLSITGGNEKSKYLFSGNILKNPGVMENSEYERFSARVNVDSDVKKWLTVGISAYGYAGKADIGTELMNTVYSFTLGSTPGMYLRSSDGRYGGMNNPEDETQSANNNPLYQLNIRKGHIKTNKINSRFYARFKPIQGLSIEPSYSYDFTDRFTYSQPVPLDIWNLYENVIQQPAKTRTEVVNNNEKWYRYLADVVATYNFKVNKLDATVVLGASQESYRKQWVYASAKDLVSNSATELDAASSEKTASGNYRDWAMHSYFGRINLAWDSKYLLEMNIRKDGSSRFKAGNTRWGVFPSFSAAWRINEENFMENTMNWLDQLKLRASWGTLGNNAMPAGSSYDGNYLHIPLYDKSNYPLNGDLQQGVAQISLSNALVTWETAHSTNFGVDFTLLKQRLNGSFDYFIKTTKDILIDLPAPLVHGTSKIPATNAATVRNNGIELNLGWNDKIGDMKYSIGVNYTYVKNKVTKFKGDIKSIDNNRLLLEGHPILAAYVLSVDRIIQTDEDLALVQAMIDNEPNAFAAYGRPVKGDFLYKDTNSDGKINDDDRNPVGNGPNPTSTYGANIGVAWKGIDFSCLLQGIAGLKQYTLNTAFQPIIRKGWMINKDISDGRWYEGRTDVATQPRFLVDGDSRNIRASDHWIQDKSYMRVKNIQLGYTFPKKLTEKAMIQTLRIYSSIDNALTFTKYK
ncbi:MAG: TonB-dependent receptor [Prevotella sp.]|jgi:TonB-linked SusC/RagA family outer membrane protein|nr:TonB-dependent receptor [Prevotella sp.]